ncbi:cysteine--tRNA ligase [Actinospongicola halichondriae]|uniref:cysteine--tRNA ligase n=1 Tax=Actinospongicola halichondriae TaxID=3236844 RepID=UPI003D54A1E4
MLLRLGSSPLPALRRARIYVCGITPYDTTHIGHATTFVWVDALSRVLEHVGIEVQVVRNITDIDDELLRAAAEQGTTWQALSTQQTFQFEDDMRKLRVQRPTFEPASRDYVTDVIFLARALLDRGAAYERDGSVFFRAGDLASMSGLSRDDALRIYDQRGGRADDPAKDDPFDAAIWQASAEGEPAWESPWGPGRPGWHAECAAMATTLLGMSIDVHAGGADLAYPHHVYENAIVEAATGVAPFSRSWMHVGTVTKGGEKVAKSTGNLVFVMDLLRDHAPQALRLHILDRPWNQTWDFDEAGLAESEAKLELLWNATSQPGGSDASVTAAVEALLDDLDVPTALGIALDEGGEAARTVAKILALL